MPDNKQTDETLQYIRDTSPVNTLCRDGNLFKKTEIDGTGEECELLQNFVWYTIDVDVSQTKMDTDEVLLVDKSKAREDSKIGEYCF